jgi:hypothetical protein
VRKNVKELKAQDETDAAEHRGNLKMILLFRASCYYAVGGNAKKFT